MQDALPMSTQAVYQCKVVNTSKKEKKIVKNFVRTFAIDTHTHNTTHTSIQAVCKVKASTQADDNVVFLLWSFYGRCASAVKAEGMHWGLVN